MDMSIYVDDKKIVMNEFVKNILTSTIISAVSSLQAEKEKAGEERKIGEDWQKIRIEINR